MTSRSRARRALAACAGAALLLGCSGTGATGDRTDPAELLRTSPCTDGSDQLCLTVGDARAWVPAGAVDVDAPVTLVDLGGPGQDPLTQASLAPLLTTGSNAVVPLEPWVTAAPSEACETALSGYVTAVREHGLTARERAASELASACATTLAAEADHTRDGIDSTVKLLRDGGVERVDMVAVSFGAERLLRTEAKVDAAVLISPYVAVEPAVDVAVRRQAAAVRVALGSPGHDDLYARVEETLPRTLRGRSVPFTRVDLSAAVAAVAYDPDAARPALLADLRALDGGAPGADARDASSGDEPLWAATAADRLAGRYGVREHFIGLVGYFGGFCAASPAASGATGSADTAAFLPAFHTVCDDLESLPVTEASAVPGCVLLSSSDPVASPQRDVSTRFPAMTVVDHAEAGHVSQASLEQALVILDGHQQGDTSCEVPD